MNMNVKNMRLAISEAWKAYNEGEIPIGAVLTDESGIFTVFVDPEHQKLGVGKRLISFLEKDEYFLRADRVEIPASITAVGFYMKLGYEPKNGDLVPDEERLIRLEKRRKL